MSTFLIHLVGLESKEIEAYNFEVTNGFVIFTHENGTNVAAIPWNTVMSIELAKPKTPSAEGSP